MQQMLSSRSSNVLSCNPQLLPSQHAYSISSARICTETPQSSQETLGWRPLSVTHSATHGKARRTRAQALLQQKPETPYFSPPAPSVTGPVQYYYREPSAWPTQQDVQVVYHDLQSQPTADLLVVGSGPSGLAVAERVAAGGFSVCVIDLDPYAPMIPNYGVWVDEMQAMGLEECLEVVWPQAKVWLDNDKSGERYLKRAYGRMDRPMLKKLLLQKCTSNGVTFLTSKVAGVSHGGGTSTVTLSDGRTMQGTMVLDATGHACKLVNFDQKFDPGYQGAYGITAEVESHPFELDTMLFMDWRDEHTHSNPAMRASNEALPTFLYVMPYTKNKVFLEETSLVARPAMGFDELKERLKARIEWLGIKVTKVEDEEYCLIPMGGVLPQHPQRVLGIGGTAGMVHPSTGFMMTRMLGSAPVVADAIIDQLSRPTDKATDAGAARQLVTEQEAEEMAAAVWRATWPVERIRQRAFFSFGMEMLLTLNLQQTRDFFAAFFSLSDFQWQGFLSARLSFTQLISFGLSLFSKATSATRTNLLRLGIPGLVQMLLVLLPTVTGYYKEDKTVMDKKFAHDQAAAAAAKTAKQQESPSASPVSQGGNPGA
uniref:lycopene beta-cyclase n=2 Tax=Dunaliella TaxID=3044 RepID=A0A1B2FQS1_DUNSA|nr:chloroplast lycopene beta-cyclase [Dunaliella salina]QIW94443.1 carotene synthesis related protein [Dunaliella salina]|mmetsp:Transcript_19758/g.51305  ORF Transcript_19758/g.51305 Transcript_19758/m.51305 type:complete len:598 (-) Transcript_19758:589-2382(-)